MYALSWDEKVTNETLQLEQLMANMVRQDTAFFDIIPSGILQERLDRDAEDLASKIFHLVSLTSRGIGTRMRALERVVKTNDSMLTSTPCVLQLLLL